MRYFVVEIPDSSEERKRQVVKTVDPLSDIVEYCVINGLHYKEVFFGKDTDTFTEVSILI